MHKILLLDIPIAESHHSLFIRAWVSHLTNIDFSFLFVNWPNFNIVVSQIIRKPEERERDKKWPVSGAIRTNTRLINYKTLVK